MLQQKGYLYRIYPTKQQQQLINQTLGCVRFVYNRFLNIRKEAWTNFKTSVTYKHTSKMLTELKCEPDYVWLKAVDDTIGRPILYGTTDTFLQCFGLNDISDLPELPEADRSILEHEQLDLFAEAELPEQEQEQESEE